MSMAKTAGDPNNVPRMPTIEECQKLQNPLRGQLELLDYDVRSAVTRGLADIESSGEDDAIYMRASVTVLLSIAARMFERSLSETGQPTTEDNFVSGAENAIEWARTRRLRYSVAGES